MNQRAAIYARVSTDDQAERGYSLPSQLDACRSFAQRSGYSSLIEMTEDHSGATPLAERPQGAKLVEMVKRRDIDAVIIFQVDRLSRDIVNLLATIQTWLRLGIDVYSLDVGKIESELDIVLVIKGWQGSDERKKIRERSMRGKRAKAKSGKVVGTRPPYGYQHLRDENGKAITLEPVEERAQIVSLIYQWYVFGDDSGNKLSANAIAHRLSETGAPTPGEINKGYHRIRNGGMWPTCTVLSILSNEVYNGDWNFGVRIGSSRNERSRDEWITVKVPAIVSNEVWQLAQEQRNRNRALSRRNAKHNYLLSGYIKCVCGCAMSGEFFSDHRYYSCTWRNNHNSKLEKRTCGARSIRAESVENDVWESIEKLFSDLPLLEELLLTAQQKEISTLDPKQDEFESIVSMITNTEREATEIGQALLRASGIVAKSLENKMEEVNNRYDALCKRRDHLHEALNSMRLTDSAIQETLQFAEDMWTGIQNADFETMRRTLELLKAKVIVTGKHFEVSSIVGNWEGDIRKLPKAGFEDDWCLPEPAPPVSRFPANRFPPAG